MVLIVVLAVRFFFLAGNIEFSFMVSMAFLMLSIFLAASLTARLASKALLVSGFTSVTSVVGGVTRSGSVVVDQNGGGAWPERIMLTRVNTCLTSVASVVGGVTRSGSVVVDQNGGGPGTVGLCRASPFDCGTVGACGSVVVDQNGGGPGTVGPPHRLGTTRVQC